MIGSFAASGLRAHSPGYLRLSLRIRRPMHGAHSLRPNSNYSIGDPMGRSEGTRCFHLALVISKEA